MKQLILGTAQLGINYGINNKVGKPSTEKAFEILNTAHENKINIIDTASAYGGSEKVIGDFTKNYNKNFRIITKLSKLSKEKNMVFQVEKELKDSLEKLYASKIDYYLYHSFEDFVYFEDVFKYLSRMKDEGIIGKLGVSIYDVEELEYILSQNCRAIDYIQIPFNVFDLRWIKQDILQRAKECEMEIAARSIFLQGLLLTDEKTAKRVDAKAYKYITELKSLCNKKGVTVEQLAMAFVEKQDGIDYIIMGCESEEQLLQNIENFNCDIEISQKDRDFILSAFGDIERKIIDPRQWK